MKLLLIFLILISTSCSTLKADRTVQNRTSVSLVIKDVGGCKEKIAVRKRLLTYSKCF